MTSFELVPNFVIWKIVPRNLGVTKIQLNLPYLGYNTVLRFLEIRHYGPVLDVSETGLLNDRSFKWKSEENFRENFGKDQGQSGMLGFRNGAKISRGSWWKVPSHTFIVKFRSSLS